MWSNKHISQKKPLPLWFFDTSRAAFSVPKYSFLKCSWFSIARYTYFASPRSFHRTTKLGYRTSARPLSSCNSRYMLGNAQLCRSIIECSAYVLMKKETCPFRHNRRQSRAHKIDQSSKNNLDIIHYVVNVINLFLVKSRFNPEAGTTRKGHFKSIKQLKSNFYLKGKTFLCRFRINFIWIS